MNKKNLFIYLRSLLTFVIFASAITWFHFHADQLLSPRVSYIVHLSLSIGITILLTISFLTLCWYLLVTVFNKGRKLTMKTRLIARILCRDKSTINSARRRLYERVFDEKGSPSQWDEFIRNI